MSNTPISSQDTPDPWLITYNNIFYLTFTLGNRVEVWSSSSLEDFHNPRKTIAWKPAPGSPWSADIWAPELHRLNEKWYVYFCGAQPGQGNPSHRTLVLRSSRQDPMDAGGWEFLGPLKGLPDHWNIDATVFSPGYGELYCVYSGWPLGDHSDTQQDLFLVQLANPEVAMEQTLVCISRAELPWERPDGGRRGVNEGPTWVDIPGSFRGIVYSANGSWTSDYKLGVLRLLDGRDPKDARSWEKRPTPLLESDEKRGGPFGPGHASFLNSPYGDGRVYCIYHATANRGEGWNNRKARILCLSQECFHPQAPTICCATGAPTHGVVHQGQNHSNVFQQGPSSGFGHRGSGGLFDKIGDRVMKKINQFGR
jgi:GH43 family beta-xylosidase